MKKAWHIALKDLQILLTDRGAVVYLFLLPIVLIVVLSVALGGLLGGDGDEPITLPVVNLDPGGELFQDLIDALVAAGGLQIEAADQAGAQARLEALEVGWMLTIPPGFSDDVIAGRPVVLRLVSHPDADDATTESILRLINGLAREMALRTRLIASFELMGTMVAAAPADFQVFSQDRIVAQAERQFERSETEPLVVIEQVQPEYLREQVAEPNAVQQNVPGFTILFVFLTAQATASSIHREKREGSFRRLMAAPISKGAMLAGKMMPNLLTGLIQIAVIFAVSVFLLPLLGLDRLTLGQDPLALMLVSVLLALCSTSLGILIAALARTEGQIGGLGALVLYTMAAVGGCLFPPFLLGGLIDVIGKAVPHYWAIQAYQDLMVRGRGLADITTELLVLLGFTLAFFAVGLWRFEFD